MTMKNRRPSDKSKSAFSLIELLVVIAIIGIIGAFAVPAAGQLLKGSSLTQAANLLTDQTAAARQQALTRSRSIEVRFYSFQDPEQPGETTPYFRALQYFEIAEGGIPNPTGRYVRFPNSVIMNSDAALSSVLSGIPSNPGSNDPDLPRGVGRNYKYISFRFQPDGATSLSATGGPSSGLWFITCHLLNDLGRATGGKPPPNFFTWMIDPVSGATKVLRPGVK
jgi:uncharacterized protein (TIGR02596 family)